MKGQHDERIPGQDRQRFTEGGMDRGVTAAGCRIVETRQVVMHQRRAVQQFDGGSGGIGGKRRVITAGVGHRQTEPGTHAGTASKHRMPHGGGKQRRAGRRLGAGKSQIQTGFDARKCVHHLLRIFGV